MYSFSMVISNDFSVWWRTMPFLYDSAHAPLYMTMDKALGMLVNDTLLWIVVHEQQEPEHTH